MAKKKVSKQDIGNLLGQWSQEFAVFVPSRGGNTTKMATWDGKDVSFLDWYRNTTVPVKALFQPPWEEMFSFQKGTDGYHVELPAADEEKRLIFGIRPCDARALAILDLTFKDGYEDPYYLARRSNSVLVGVGCTNPYDSCFCTSLGVDPGKSNDVDLMLIDVGDHFLIEEITPAGSALITQAGELENATEADEAWAGERKEISRSKVVRKVHADNIREKLLACFEDKDYWEKVAAKCISCGVCTLLCPTCHCFDINDELVRERATRFRSCDSCAFPIYTKMPMENPREHKWQRVRQKVCHKFEFSPMNFGVMACVGCGRCIRLCPVNWDITRVLEGVPANSVAWPGGKNADR